MKKERENKGITLIALIITIIVMLILVGVSVNVALNGGLFKTAKTATEKTNDALAQEKDLVTYATLIAKTDEFVEKYPLGLTMVNSNGSRRPKFTNSSVIDLYEEILEAYGISYSELSLSQAIKTANVFYEIAKNGVPDAATLQNTEALRYIQNSFWNNFGEIMTFADFDNDENSEKANKLLALQSAFCFCKYNERGQFITIGGNGSDKCTLIPEANLLKAEDNAVTLLLDGLFPGGSLSIEEITGTSATLLDDSLISGIDVTKCKFLEVTGSNASKIKMLGDDAVQTQDIIGKTIVVVPAQNDDEYDYYGVLVKNVLVINGQTGNIAYIDDNAVANKSIY